MQKFILEQHVLLNIQLFVTTTIQLAFRTPKHVTEWDKMFLLLQQSTCYYDHFL